MTVPGLTKRRPAAKSLHMQVMEQGAGRSRRRAASVSAIFGVFAMAGAAMVSGCISVSAPDKPIVIELNINIRQDVVYSLAPDAKNTIESNSGIF
jgi:hypothetical protein